MKIEEILNVINDIEKKYKVNEWNIQGIALWPFIRIENYYLMSIAELNNSSKVNARSKSYMLSVILAKFKTIIAKILDYKKNANLKKADVIHLNDGVSFVNLNDSWYARFFDPVDEILNKKGLKSIRLDMAHEFLIPRYSPSIFIQSQVDNVIIKSLIKAKISKPKFNQENWGDYDAFFNDESSNKNLISLPSKNQLRQRIYKVLNLVKYYENILKKSKPKIAFIISYYGDQQLAFIIACNKLGIKTVDIQHGVQGDYHLAYGSWANVPNNGYESLPNYFLVWSESEAKSINSWSKFVNNHHALVSGNMFANIWKNPENPLAKEYDKKIQNIFKYKDKPVVLLTLSPYTEASMHESWEALKQTQTKYNWLIRLHPGMLAEKQSLISKLTELGINDYEIEKSSSLPLYAILRNIDLHITVQSTCVIEAEEFGVKSLITSEYGSVLYKEQIDNGNSIFCSSIKEIIDNLLTINKNDKKVFKFEAENQSIQELLNKI